eukprot:13957542-Alexandrium_andersonii.AAC.1
MGSCWSPRAIISSRSSSHCTPPYRTASRATTTAIMIPIKPVNSPSCSKPPLRSRRSLSIEAVELEVLAVEA